MKLGSKPDSFQTNGDSNRYVASELATDIVIRVGETKFHLHKFPLLSKSGRLQKLVASINEGNNDEIHIPDLPGGAAAFEICAKFCYGMTVTLNAYNVITARCAAEYLGMDESLEKGNLIYKIDVFLSCSILRSWKDSIICLQTTKYLLPWSEDLKLISHCVDAVASKASVDVSKVNWSYTYSSKKLPEEIGNNSNLNGFRSRAVPKDWWVEDLCELEVDLYKRVMTGVKSRGVISGEVIGEALKAYATRKLSGFNKGFIQCSDVVKARSIVDVIVWLLPPEKGCVSCSFLLRLLKAANLVHSSETVKTALVKRIGQQLEGASPNDLLIQAQEGETTTYDVAIVKRILEEFIMQDRDDEIQLVVEEDGHDEIEGITRPGILSEASKLMVAKLVDGYLTEIAKDPNLPLSMFIGLAEMVSGFNRPSHDGLYRGIDTYLKEHPGTAKSERKRICKLMDCKKLSADACTHAVQNERLPMRVIVQVLFFEQVRAAASSGSSTPDLPKGIIPDLRSHGSSRSVRTTTDEDWDGIATVEELRALRAEVAALRIGSERNGSDPRISVDRGGVPKGKMGPVSSKRIFSKIWSRKTGQGENNSGSDSSESHNSINPELEVKCTPSINRRNSIS